MVGELKGALIAVCRNHIHFVRNPTKFYPEHLPVVGLVYLGVATNAEVTFLLTSSDLLLGRRYRRWQQSPDSVRVFNQHHVSATAVLAPTGRSLLNRGSSQQ